MKTLRDYIVAGALYVNDTGIEAQVSDQVTLFLDTDAEPGFPESIVATIQHPIVKVECGSSTSYVLEYDEADLLGAAALLRAQDIIDSSVVSGVTVVATELDAEISRALAAEALLAPKASPTFTGTVTLPSTTSIGTVSDVELGYLNGVSSAIQTQLNAKAPSASPTFTGTITLDDAVAVVLNATTGTKIGTATTQKLAFHNATPVVQRAGAAQGAVVAITGGESPTEAEHNLVVTLVNELRAALVEKGIIKGSA
jgi:hypothetical protein